MLILNTKTTLKGEFRSNTHQGDEHLSTVKLTQQSAFQ